MTNHRPLVIFRLTFLLGICITGCGGSSAPGVSTLAPEEFDNTPSPGDANFPFSPTDPEYEDYLDFLENDDEIDYNQADLTPIPTMADRDIPGSNFYSSGNNSRLMSGRPIGTSNADSPLGSDMEVYVRNSTGGLRIGSVRKVHNMSGWRSGTTSDQLFVGVIHNISRVMRCVVQVGITDMIGVGGKIFDGAQSLTKVIVSGELGVEQTDGREGDIHRDCVSPNSRIYFAFSGPELGEQSISKINFNFVSPRDWKHREFDVADARVVPRGYSYTLNSEDDRDYVYATVDNLNDEAIKSFVVLDIVYQDLEGRAIGLSGGDVDTRVNPLDPRASSQVQLRYFYQAFPGSTSRLRGVTAEFR